MAPECPLSVVKDLYSSFPTHTRDASFLRKFCQNIFVHTQECLVNCLFGSNSVHSQQILQPSFQHTLQMSLSSSNASMLQNKGCFTCTTNFLHQDRHCFCLQFLKGTLLKERQSLRLRDQIYCFGDRKSCASKLVMMHNSWHRLPTLTTKKKSVKLY